VARGTGAARRLIDRMLEGKEDYHFVEVMACPGGCVGGGGQPIYTETNDWNEQVSHRARRSRGLLELDRQKDYRKAHENPMILNLYEEYLGQPGGPCGHINFSTPAIFPAGYMPTSLCWYRMLIRSKSKVAAGLV
jgi:iron only hydrogenase large subunit-like protein